mgnify:CR=1 FL=1
MEGLRGSQRSVSKGLAPGRLAGGGTGAFRGLNECIHVNPWYAAKAGFAIACDFYALFLPLSLMLAARRIRALPAEDSAEI